MNLLMVERLDEYNVMWKTKAQLVVCFLKGKYWPLSNEIKRFWNINAAIWRRAQERYGMVKDLLEMCIKTLI